MEDISSLTPADLSLENIVQTSLNYENLRIVLDYILQQLKNQNTRV